MIPELSLLGLLLSVYALYVKERSKDKKYRPLCDISRNISCTKAFSSRYYNRFLVPNPVIGGIYYTAIIALSFTYPWFVFYASIPALLFSVYLAYVSYAKQKNFCLVCSSIYLINILLFISSFNS
ncbi:TPA: hypothetical protein HA239_01460 [Candidatus Woesearchaeota archaeon]|nr:hypothetical protein QT06_C0001G0893 [archaeon GW2011_AR15]MBS3103329.1 hypothetical protein [Candidatus Woesearchaeota archaeon]HIH41060.1 hypothetical protein [Candidatus Woesearchaeota archaeon]